MNNLSVTGLPANAKSPAPARPSHVSPKSTETLCTDGVILQGDTPHQEPLMPKNFTLKASAGKEPEPTPPSDGKSEPSPKTIYEAMEREPSVNRQLDMLDAWIMVGGGGS